MRSCLIGVLAAACLLAASPAGAAGGEAFMSDKPGNDVGNSSSLQRGARNFVNYCLGCHSAKYVRYNRLAADIGITEDQLINNLMFVTEKPHDTMLVSMPPNDARRWFGQTPPDLTLIARSRGTQWLYNFLRAFYMDDQRPTGVNNIVMSNVAMPNVLWELQGQQRAVFEDEVDDDGNVIRSSFSHFEQVSEGKLAPEDFDLFVRDLVNFLEYIGEPSQLERRQLGIWVLIYLLVFGLFALALKNEVWKDIK